MTTSQELRQQISQSRRIIVKIGSRVLVQKNGRPDLRRMRALVKDLTDAQRGGREVVVVSSGAVSAGMQALSLKTRPTNLPDLQMAAAVGQTRLMTTYEKFFRERRRKVGQVLLTHDDLNDRRRHLNARNTILNLLRHGIIPIVNENDVVAVDEIKFGDNDALAALVTHLLDADLLVLLTTSDGLREPTKGGRTKRASHIDRITDRVLSWVADKKSHLSTGGMTSKLESARLATESGAWAVIADGRKSGTLSRVLAGEDVGTLIADGRTSAETSMKGRKKWIAYFHKPQGTLVVDDGARDALLHKGTSLLPIGIKRVDGDFKTGAVVHVATKDGTRVARGLVEYDSESIRKIMGRKTSEIKGLLGSKDYDEVIHRDNMALNREEE